MNKSCVILKDYFLASAYQKQFKRRIDYLYEEFVPDKQSYTMNMFIDLINKSYYKFAADEYTFPWDLRSYYVDVLAKLEPGFDIVDIGAGTGFSYDLVRSIGYCYSNYYFVEPSKNMSDRLKSDDPRLVIINDYIENSWNDIKSNKNKKLFIMNAALHHIIDLDKFAKDIRDSMNDSDIFFIPYEPNNGYQRSFLAYLFSIINTLKNPKSIVTGFAAKLHLLSTLQKMRRSVNKFLGKIADSETNSLTKSLNDLVNSKIVTSQFTEHMIYAITDYGVYDNWKGISIPNEFNEGFYTLDNINKILGLHVFYVKTYTYQQPKDLNSNKLAQFIDKKLRPIFPTSGAFICMALKK